MTCPSRQATFAAVAASVQPSEIVAAARYHDFEHEGVMRSVWRQLWQSRCRLFVSAYLRDVLWGSVYAGINDVLALVAFVGLFVAFPSIVPSWATPLRLLAVTVIAATIRGYWRMWSRTMPSEGCELTDSELTIVASSQTVPNPVTNAPTGTVLGFECVARAPNGIESCRFRVEQLWAGTAEDWARVPWFTPTDLEWDSGGVVHTLQLGAQRVARLVWTDPSTGRHAVVRRDQTGISIVPGRYRAVISVEAAGYRVRKVEGVFIWGSEDSDQPRLEWAGPR